MAVKKQRSKDQKENQKEQGVISGTAKTQAIPAQAPEGRITLDIPTYSILDKLSSAATDISSGAYYANTAGPFATYQGLSLVTSIVPSLREQEVEDEIVKLRKQLIQLQKDIAAKAEHDETRANEIERLQKNVEDLDNKQRFHYLLYRVNERARTKLLDSKEFSNRFEKTDSCNAVIMSVDIRRSTELMLKARDPQLYANLIRNLCTELTRIILDNYGVFDKFTGDGILAFFPDFYTGEDAPYLAIKAAEDCHNCFYEHYQRARSCFNSVLTNVGLGIGIDYGQSHLVKIQDGLTVIGTPVVYACRMSGCKAGQTLLNQPAYEVAAQKLGGYVNFQETEIDVKHEGATLAYVATLTRKAYKPKLPDWDKLPTTAGSQGFTPKPTETS